MIGDGNKNYIIENGKYIVLLWKSELKENIKCIKGNIIYIFKKEKWIKELKK